MTPGILKWGSWLISPIKWAKINNSQRMSSWPWMKINVMNFVSQVSPMGKILMMCCKCLIRLHSRMCLHTGPIATTAESKNVEGVLFPSLMKSLLTNSLLISWILSRTTHFSAMITRPKVKSSSYRLLGINRSTKHFSDICHQRLLCWLLVQNKVIQRCHLRKVFSCKTAWKNSSSWKL